VLLKRHSNKNFINQLTNKGKSFLRFAFVFL